MQKTFKLPVRLKLMLKDLIKMTCVPLWGAIVYLFFACKNGNADMANVFFALGDDVCTFVLWAGAAVAFFLCALVSAFAVVFFYGLDFLVDWLTKRKSPESSGDK